jgi:hypothetical protein
MSSGPVVGLAESAAPGAFPAVGTFPLRGSIHSPPMAACYALRWQAASSSLTGQAGTQGLLPESQLELTGRGPRRALLGPHEACQVDPGRKPGPPRGLHPFKRFNGLLFATIRAGHT